ncbi:ankyrin repeats (many copies) domain-containing protein [Pochonia chlamydosporia 170]|uniref:Ankyrin repeats (Many copies) domain-containing protein n=1 Tax=Pochonia chlamydosporia 170 TaxID=1380566 RepID=A0A179F9P4_METCM|nr:ankyrin repeats (many copies) domain-containing protein [Pochonia chlamydosporia 170]OAQ62172.1 ankyrin repeats (many copies) domain-containing protein [Pochonia chlamydosporia 170]
MSKQRIPVENFALCGCLWKDFPGTDIVGGCGITKCYQPEFTNRAALGGHGDIARMLLMHQALYDVRDETGETPLALATAGGHSDILELLIEEGASVETEDGSGDAPVDTTGSQEN